MAGAFLGPASPQDEIEQRLYAAGANFEVPSGPALVHSAAKALGDGCALGWFQGRMECRWHSARALAVMLEIQSVRADDADDGSCLRATKRESRFPTWRF
jgi:hypothetical protein